MLYISLCVLVCASFRKFYDIHSMFDQDVIELFYQSDINDLMIKLYSLTFYLKS